MLGALGAGQATGRELFPVLPGERSELGPVGMSQARVANIVEKIARARAKLEQIKSDSTLPRARKKAA